jgi:hypothetical protein
VKDQPKQEAVNLNEQTSETLALFLNQLYGQIIQCQQNILAVNQILEQRQIKNGTLEKGK